MKMIATILAILGLMAIITTQANAYWTSDLADGKVGGAHYKYRHETAGHYAKAALPRYARRSNDTAHDAAYWLAVRQGGPCGLIAERNIFGSSAHVLNGWNPWLAREWKGFPETSPTIHMVAVWRNDSHVEVIHTLDGSGRFNGSRRLADVVVVDPRGQRRNVYDAYRPHHRHRRYAGML